MNNEYIKFILSNFTVSKFNTLVNQIVEQEKVNQINSYIDKVFSLHRNCGDVELLKANKHLMCYLESEFYKNSGIDFPKFLSEINTIADNLINEDYDFYEQNNCIVFEEKQVKGKFESLTEEMTRKQLMTKNDPMFLKQSERQKQLPSTRFVDITKDILIFRTWSAEHSKNHREYTQRVRMMDLFSLLIEKKKKLKKGKKVDRAFVYAAAKEALLSGDLEIFCSCPAFLFWGFRFIAKRNHALAKHGFKDWPYAKNSKINNFPKDRNPTLQGMYCKHMSLVMGALPMILERIATKFTKKYL